MSDKQPAKIIDVLRAFAEFSGVVEASFLGLKSQVNDLRSDVISVRKELGGVREDVASVREDVASVREDVASVREDVASVREDTIAFRKDVTVEFETVRSEATRSRVQMMSRFERIENSLSQIKDEMAVTWHKTERSNERADSLRDEMSETEKQITAMWRIVRRVQSEWESRKGQPDSPSP